MFVMSLELVAPLIGVGSLLKVGWGNQKKTRGKLRGAQFPVSSEG